MCGIAGVVGGDFTAEGLTATVQHMARAVAHRGPDAEGYHVEAADHLALGHRRLAVIDLSPTGAQPMTSASGRWTIVFNGEIYNFADMRAELQQNGVRLRGSGDTEVLLEAIDRYGMHEALRRTNGMFAFAAWDRAEHRLTVARDRLGEKPLYWVAAAGTVAFGSELRALRVVPGLQLEIDPASVAAMLRWSFVPHPHTIYRGVRQLAPGHLLDIDLSGSSTKVTEREWWSLAETLDASVARRRPISIEAAAEELEPLLHDAVRIRMASDVPLGAFLSGGIDSSLVAALAARSNAGGPIDTFTVAMPDVGLDESVHAAAVAAHLGSRHHEVRLSLADALAEIPTLATTWDEPFADPSMLPSALLCRAARRSLTVCLGGDGGDELFAGYNRHAVGASLHHRTARIPAGLRSAAGRIAMAPSPRAIDAMGRLIPARRRPPNLGDKVHKAGALLRGNDDAWAALAGVWDQSCLGVVAHPPAVPATRTELGPVEQMMLADTAAVLPDQMLVKVDRAAMAAALEVRVPLLDHRLLEWSWRQPIEVLTAGGVGKRVLRRVAETVLPADIVRRPKMGFDPPLAGWLRAELKPWAADVLAHPRSVREGWIDSEALTQVWVEHQSGRRNHEYRLWGLLMLEQWLAAHHPH